MGILLHFTRPVRHQDQHHLVLVPPDPPLTSHAERRAHFHLMTGGLDPMTTSTIANPIVRRPFVGEVTTISSPEDENVQFYLKRCSVEANIRRANQASTVRYAQRTRGANEEFVTERDMPMGDMMLLTVELGLDGWNLTDEQGRAIPVTQKNLQTYLSPREFNFLYREVLKVNPMWGDNGEEDTKKD